MFKSELRSPFHVSGPEAQAALKKQQTPAADADAGKWGFWRGKHRSQRSHGQTALKRVEEGTRSIKSISWSRWSEGTCFRVLLAGVPEQVRRVLKPL